MPEILNFTLIDARHHHDLAQLVDLDRDAFAGDGLTTSNLSLLAIAGRVYALKSGDDILADAIILPTCTPNLALLFSFAVLSHRRSQGLGRQLMGHLLPELAKQGWKRLQLTVDPANGPAVHLYTRVFSFRQIDDLPDCLGPGKRRLLLEIALSI